MTADPLGVASVAEEAWEHPSARLSTLRHLEIGVVTVVIAVVVLAALLGPSAVAAGIVTAVVVVVGVAADVVAQRRVRAWGFAERDEDLLVRRGVAFRRLSVIPYGRMQYVEVTAGPFERLFGLASVKMHTAAAASDARVPGLTAEDAGRLRDRLTEQGEARAAGL